MTVQALDLGLIVPVSVMIAWLAWRRTSIGYVLGSTLRDHVCGNVRRDRLDARLGRHVHGHVRAAAAADLRLCNGCLDRGCDQDVPECGDTVARNDVNELGADWSTLNPRARRDARGKFEGPPPTAWRGPSVLLSPRRCSLLLRGHWNSYLDQLLERLGGVAQAALERVLQHDPLRLGDVDCRGCTRP